MNNYIIKHLFEFWEYIGTQGNFVEKEKGFIYTQPLETSWPSKAFRLDTNVVNFSDLAAKMVDGTLPNSLGIIADSVTERILLAHQFQETSVVKGMYLKFNPERIWNTHFPTIREVTSEIDAVEFAKVASRAFGYKINRQTIMSLLDNRTDIRLYIGKHNGAWVNCGIVFLDQNNVSGIHMIGTIKEFRGLGLGKDMTIKLIGEAYKNKSSEVVLVASKSGERIYSKLGFIAQGSLKSYAKVEFSSF